MKATDYRCFYLTYPSGQVFTATGFEDGEIRCFGSRDRALEFAHQGVNERLGIPLVMQRENPCLTLVCGGCDYVWDEDDDGIVHFDDRADALAFAAEVGWLVLAGEPLCGGCKPDGWSPAGVLVEPGDGEAPLFEESP